MARNGESRLAQVTKKVICNIEEIAQRPRLAIRNFRLRPASQIERTSVFNLAYQVEDQYTPQASRLHAEGMYILNIDFA